MTGKLLCPRWVDSMPTDSDDSRSSPSQSLAGSSEADTGDLSGLSDLLEIGMIQRKAYEEAKQAEAEAKRQELAKAAE